MRGIVHVGGGEIVVTDDLAVREPGPTEVTVRLAAAGVCHSDLSVLDGTIPYPTPVVCGHEGAGVVEAVGGAVRGVAPGDHVVVSTLASCGRCAACAAGVPTRCRASIGNIDRPFTFRGEPAYNFAATSSFAERIVVDAVQAVPISPEVPFTSACLIACGVITGVGAVLNRARVRTGETAAVFGVGGVGLNVVQALRRVGASRIVAVDANPAKEALARSFGATDFVATRGTSPDTAEVVRAMFPAPGIHHAGGVDWAFECTGIPAVLATAFETLDWGGTAVAVGVPAPGAELSTVINRLTHVDRGIMGCRYGSARPHADFPMIAALYLDGRLMLDELVSATAPLADFETIVAAMHEGRLARGVLTFTE
jgi:S-(hydroxymethyl)glutathione dehydrogenase/alcohol dehydrogenase